MSFFRSKAFILFSICVAVLIVVSFLQAKGFGSPIQELFVNTPRPVSFVFETATKPVKNFFTTIFTLRDIARENIVLTNKVYDLQQQLADYDQTKRENDVLKQELGFVQPNKQAYVPCTVLTQNPLGLTDTFVLNCGQNSGVSQGLGVVSQGHLVGKIVFAGKTSSTALLLTSSQFSTDARISKTGATGVVEGSFGSGLLLDQLSQSDVAQKGDLVVTAGINNQIPKDIVIGEVGDVLSAPNDLFKKTTLVSSIDFSNLEFVFVVK